MYPPVYTELLSSIAGKLRHQRTGRPRCRPNSLYFMTENMDNDGPAIMIAALTIQGGIPEIQPVESRFYATSAALVRF